MSPIVAEFRHGWGAVTVKRGNKAVYMSTLVTGGTGLLGNNVVRLLLARGESVRVLIRRNCDERPLADLDVEICIGDVRDPESIARAFVDVDRVVHAAAVVQIGWSGLPHQQAVNVEGTRTVAKAARRSGARMVHVSSADTLGFGSAEWPVSEESPRDVPVACPYVLTKRQAEEAVLEQVRLGLDAVIVNPAYMLGPWDWKPSSGRMLLAVARGRGMLAPSGGNSFCHVGDVAAGMLAALDRGRTGERYILGGQEVSYQDAWRVFADVACARRPIGVAPPWMLRAAGKAGDLWTRISRHEPNVNSAAISLALLARHLAGTRAAAELNYFPRPYRQGVEEAWEWFCQFGYAPRRARRRTAVRQLAAR